MYIFSHYFCFTSRKLRNFRGKFTWPDNSTYLARYRGYYTAVRRYEFYHEKIKFISSNRRVMFCLLYSRKQFKTQVSKINFRSIMIKTWLYFNLFHRLFKLKQYLYILLFFSCSISIFFDTNMWFFL